MQAEQRAGGSTGGYARAYRLVMRNTLAILALSLMTVACGDDAPVRPMDGTVPVWESCLWEGQLTSELCAPDLACTHHGVCAPLCESISECPEFEGYKSECGPLGTDHICEIVCNADEQCPKTGGVDLHCLDFYCIGDL